MRWTAAWLFALLTLQPATFAAQQRPDGPLRLEDCLRLALAHNRRLAATRHDLEVAEAGVVAARGASYPRLDLTGGYLRFEEPPAVSLLGQSFQLGRENAFFADLGIQQPVYTGGAIRGRIRASEGLRTAAAADRDAAEEELALAVHRSFYAVLLARELVGVRQASLDQLEAHLRATRDRLREGAASEFDALRAEVELANHRPLLVAAENELQSAREQLTRLLGYDPRRPVEVAGDLSSSSSLEEPAEPQARRPELAAAAARELAAEAAVEEALARRRPTVSWLAHLFLSSPEYLVAADSTPELNAIAGVMVKLPLATGGRRRARILTARAEADKAQDLRRDLEDQVALEVQAARRRLREAEATLAAQGRVIEQAEKALEIARVRYQNGLGAQLEVTDAQLALAEARVRRLEAVYHRAVAGAELRRARAETLLPPDTEVDERGQDDER